MKSLGEDLCELFRGSDPNQTPVSILNRFVGEVLPDVNVLGPFSTSNIGGVHDLGAKIHAAQEVSEINPLNSLSRC